MSSLSDDSSTPRELIVGHHRCPGVTMQLIEVYSEPRIKAFLDARPEIQAHWVADMFCRNLPNGYPKVYSNVQPGDMFGLGGLTQVGFITRIITVIQVESKNPQWSPQGEGGNYLQYDIGGDVGGWFRLDPVKLKSGHFIWLPTPERLLLAGMVQHADELSKLMREIILGRPESDSGDAPKEPA